MKRKNFLNRKALLAAGLIALVLCMAFISCDLPEENEVTGITLNKSGEISIAEGDVDYLYITAVQPAGATYTNVTWSSSDPTVATVSNGIIKTLASSANKSTVITAKTGTGAASCTFNVTAASTSNQVSKVTLNPTSVTLTTGGTAELITSFTPANPANTDIFYLSDKPGVATVDLSSGVVTAVATGSATITVTTKNKGKTATCTVTVQAPAGTPVTGLTLDKDNITLAVGASETLTPTVLPDNATNKTVLWDSSNDDIATVDEDGKVTAKAEGTAIIFATTVDGAKKTICIVTVSGTAPPATGLTVTPSSIILLIGSISKDALLTTNAQSGTSLSWESSDTSIATVVGGTGVGGTVTSANKAGKTTITVTAGGATGTCTVTVIDPTDPTALYGTYTTQYMLSGKLNTEKIILAKDSFHIEDNEKTGSNMDFLDFTITEWKAIANPADANYKTDYPIALSITGKITGAKPSGATPPLYGGATAPGFKQSDINVTVCTMYLYISNTGTFIRTPFSSSTIQNGPKPVATNTSPAGTLRVYTKAAATP